VATDPTDRNDDDSSLVRKCREGQIECFGILVERYQKAIYNIAFRIVGNRDDALDVAQTTFLKSFEGLDSFRLEARFFSWLCRIAINESINTVKKRRPREPLTRDIESDSESPQQQHEEARRSEFVMAAMSELSPDARCIILLRHFLDISLRDMSDILNVPEKTIKSRLYTARQQLGAILRKQGGSKTCLTTRRGIESTGKLTGN